MTIHLKHDVCVTLMTLNYLAVTWHIYQNFIFIFQSDQMRLPLYVFMKLKDMSVSDSRCCNSSFSTCWHAHMHTHAEPVSGCLPQCLDSVSSPFLPWLWSGDWPPQSSLSCQHCRPIYPAPIHQPVNEVAGLLGCGKTIHPPTIVQSQHTETASSLLAGLCWQS